MTHDISDSLLTILQLIANCFSACFNIMQSIEFLGTNLLNFSIAIFVLGALIPIIFSLVRSNTVHSVREYRRSRIKHYNSDD